MKSFTSPEENIFSYMPWWLKTRHGVKQIELDGYEQRAGGLIVHIKGVDDRDQASSYTNVDIAVEKAQLPDLEAGDFYWFQLLGLEVSSHYQGEVYHLGEVQNLLETGANDVLVVKPSSQSIDGRERLVPYVPDTYVKQVDLAAGVIIVEWDPEF